VDAGAWKLELDAPLGTAEYTTDDESIRRALQNCNLIACVSDITYFFISGDGLRPWDAASGIWPNQMHTSLREIGTAVCRRSRNSPNTISNSQDWPVGLHVIGWSWCFLVHDAARVGCRGHLWPVRGGAGDCCCPIGRSSRDSATTGLVNGGYQFTGEGSCW